MPGVNHTHSYIESRGEALTEVHLLIVVTKIYVAANAEADESVVPKAVGLHFILVRAVLHLLFRAGSLREGRTKSQGAQGGQKDFLSHLVVIKKIN